jgi:hypothetical protein
VQPHSHRDGIAREDLVRVERGGSGTLGGRKRDEEGVTSGFDLEPAPGVEGRPQHASVLGERLRVLVRAQGVQRPGGALDVGEEERDGAGRQIRPHGVVL